MAILRGSEQLMTVREVAALLNAHSNTVRRWSDQQIIRAYRIGPRGDRRFKREDIVCFLKSIVSNSGDERSAGLHPYD